MDAHRRHRLTGTLEAEGLDALCATTTENVYYVSGLPHYQRVEDAVEITASGSRTLTRSSQDLAIIG
jgi:hypothetical protein